MTTRRNLLTGLAVAIAMTAACGAPAQARTTGSVLGSHTAAHVTSSPLGAPVGLRTLGKGARSTLPTAQHSAFPGAVRLDDGRLLAVWRQGSEHLSGNGIIRGATSSDNGATWSAATTKLAWNRTDLRDPSLASVDGVLYMTFCVSKPPKYGIGVFVARSTDGGVSWFTQARLDPHWPRAGATAPLVQLTDGRLLQMFYGHPAGETRGSVWAAFSTDGKAWTDPKRILNGQADGRDYEEPWATVTQTGVKVFMRWGLVERVGVVSFDGSAWSNAHPLWDGTGRPSCVANDAKVLCVYRAIDPTWTYRPAMMRLSTDNGETFGPAAILDGSAMLFAYAAPVVSGKGWDVIYSMQSALTAAKVYSQTVTVR